MALRDKLHALDHNFFPGTRDDQEDAETFLRRVAGSRAITPAQAGDVMAALREYLGVEPQAGSDHEQEQKDEADGSEGDDKTSEESKESDDKDE
jgi:hypothetical protein